jgi:hypothetical protein
VICHSFVTYTIERKWLRVETKKRDPKEIMDDNQRTGQQITEGTAYSETIEVLGVDKSAFSVTVYAVSERQFLKACREGKVDFAALKENKPEMLLQNLEFMSIFAREATHNPAIDNQVVFGETAKITLKSFALSGIIPKVETAQA